MASILSATPRCESLYAGPWLSARFQPSNVAVWPRLLNWWNSTVLYEGVVGGLGRGILNIQITMMVLVKY